MLYNLQIIYVTIYIYIYIIPHTNTSYLKRVQHARVPAVTECLSSCNVLIINYYIPIHMAIDELFKINVCIELFERTVFIFDQRSIPKHKQKHYQYKHCHPLRSQ